ncbi:hypothetical protein HPB49_017246 [Dermacentor silvarum]|uniref:Uncharacterized protein n=1 Tax=Dermacentor silvarum TaxID=543639 RepID=A0ACB8C4K4_DERSI|nr:hypothetical protein HPB49_017246 [Dermacentor silvarum]
MKAHFKVHPGEHPLEYHSCPQSFLRSPKLMEHLCIHAGERSFQFPSCPHIFSHKSNMKQHLCIHTGDRPQRHTVCSKSILQPMFGVSWTLRSASRHGVAKVTKKCSHILKNKGSTAWTMSYQVPPFDDGKDKLASYVISIESYFEGHNIVEDAQKKFLSRLSDQAYIGCALDAALSPLARCSKGDEKHSHILKSKGIAAWAMSCQVPPIDDGKNK